MDVLDDNQNPADLSANLVEPSLLEIPPYVELNRAIGLPDQSVALEEAVRVFGEDLPRRLQEALQTAPFLFKTNFFINNIAFFLWNIKRCEAIFRKFGDIAARRFIIDAPDEVAVYELLTFVFAGLATNKKVGRNLQLLLGAFDALLTRFLALARGGVELTIGQFLEMLNVLITCRSQAEIDRILNEIKPGENVQQGIERSGVKPAKYKMSGFKILDGCTIQCRYCCENAKAKRDEWHLMTIDDLKKMDWLLDDIVQVSVSGGEPFDSPYLFEIMRYLSEKGAAVAFLTSGGEIEDLEKMLPYFKDGTICRTDISMHDSVGLRGKRRFQNTRAFLIRHNIPFVIIPKGTDRTDINSKAAQLGRELGELGLWNDGGLMQDGRNMARPYCAQHPLAFHRDPLVKVEYTFVLPSARLTDDGTIGNLRELVRLILNSGMKPSQLCRFGNLDFRSDGTVSACDAIMGPLRAKRLMDHFPESEAELDAAVAEYRARMQEIWDEADRRGCHTCQVHLERDAGVKMPV